MLELVASEAAALLAGDDADGRLADLNVRTAFASWDGLRELAEAIRYLELAETHPLAPRLRLMATLLDEQALAAAEPRLGESVTILVELAETWLIRHGKAERAAALCDRLLDEELKPHVRAHVVELATLAHAAAGEWSRVVAIRKAALGPKTGPEEVAATAALLIDRAADPAAALDACWAAIERLDGIDDDVVTQPAAAVTRVGVLRVIDVAIDAAERTADARLIELMDRRAELVATLPGGGLETLATRHHVAATLTRDEQHAEAAKLWTQLADDTVSAHPLAGKRIATLGAAFAAAAAKDSGLALAARRRLADAESVEIAACHAWRALELAAAGADVAAVPQLAQAVVDVADSTVAEWWVDMLDLKAPGQAMLARLEERGGLSLRWAAIIAERMGQPERAIELWRRAIAGGLGTEHDHLVRLLRGGDEDQLSEAYTGWAKAETDPKTQAVVWCARGVVDLIRGDFVEGEESL
ncbi:MAG: hypothetical protein JO257_13620, partial [Deltaproteobacteria bacterium]|nr:hypothetical protein [Deltaproteobacteria bacterium]